MAVALYEKTNDYTSLITYLNELYDLCRVPRDKILLAQCYKSICDCVTAERFLLDVLALPKLPHEEMSMCLEMLSEVCLYLEKFEDSYTYAKQNAEANELIPTHRSHLVLLTRAMKCEVIAIVYLKKATNLSILIVKTCITNCKPTGSFLAKKG